MSVSGSNVDDEVRAMALVANALRDLDRGQCVRVIRWAEQRWVRLDTPDIDRDFMTKFTTALAEAANQVGNVTGLDIVNALSAAERERAAREIGKAAA